MQTATSIPRDLDAPPLQPGLPSLWRVTLSIGKRISRQRKKLQLVAFQEDSLGKEFFRIAEKLGPFLHGLGLTGYERGT
jgi:hypothetical protein